MNGLETHLHLVRGNPFWCWPNPPEENTWLVGISYKEIRRETEPYALALFSQFLRTQLYEQSLIL